MSAPGSHTTHAAPLWTNRPMTHPINMLTKHCNHAPILLFGNAATLISLFGYAVLPPMSPMQCQNKPMTHPTNMLTKHCNHASITLYVDGYW